MKISKWCEVQIYGKKSVLVNNHNGKWMYISTECFNIIQKACGENLSLEEFLSLLYDDDDRNYMNKLIKEMINIEVLVLKSDLQVESCAYLAITNRCNLVCKHCSYNAMLNNIKNKDIMSLDEIKYILDTLEELPISVVTITGGEPLVRSDALDIFNYAKLKKVKLLLMTNGTLITKENAKTLADCFEKIDISLDGFDEYSCSQIRGKGVFKRVLSGIEYLHNEGMNKISLSMVLTEFNNNHKDEFIDLCKKINVQPVLRKFIPLGRGEDNKAELIDRTKYHITIDKKYLECRTCGAGRTVIQIDYDGSIYPCGLLRDKKYKLGNILNMKESLKKLITNDFAFEKIKCLIPEYNIHCSKCKVNQFCWSCLAEHSIEMLQNGCDIYKKQKLYKSIWGSNI